MPSPLPHLGEAVGAPQNLSMASLRPPRKGNPALPPNAATSDLPSQSQDVHPSWHPSQLLLFFHDSAPSPQARLGTPGTVGVWALCGPRAPVSLALSDSTRAYTGFTPHPGARDRLAVLAAACAGESRPAPSCQALPDFCLTHLAFLPRLTPSSPHGVQNILRGRGWRDKGQKGHLTDEDPEAWRVKCREAGPGLVQLPPLRPAPN